MKLSDLPNREGYRFVGLFKDKSKYSCRIVKGHVSPDNRFVSDPVRGYHLIIREDTGLPCYDQLAEVVETLPSTRGTL